MVMGTLTRSLENMSIILFRCFGLTNFFNLCKRSLHLSFFKRSTLLWVPAPLFSKAYLRKNLFMNLHGCVICKKTADEIES